MTKIINFFASPGAGKSTTAAGLFSKMKQLGYKCELIHEYAKDVVYRGDIDTLNCQPYIFGKQLFKMTVPTHTVDYVITDSPILLSVVYNKAYPISFNQAVIDIFQGFDNLNFFIPLDSSRYKEYGRVQTLRESLEVETQIKILLDKLCISYVTVKAADIEKCLQVIQEK